METTIYPKSIDEFKEKGCRYIYETLNEYGFEAFYLAIPDMNKDENDKDKETLNLQENKNDLLSCYNTLYSTYKKNPLDIIHINTKNLKGFSSYSSRTYVNGDDEYNFCSLKTFFIVMFKVAFSTYAATLNPHLYKEELSDEELNELLKLDYYGDDLVYDYVCNIDKEEFEKLCNIRNLPVKGEINKGSFINLFTCLLATVPIDKYKNIKNKYSNGWDFILNLDVPDDEFSLFNLTANAKLSDIYSIDNELLRGNAILIYEQIELKGNFLLNTALVYIHSYLLNCNAAIEDDDACPFNKFVHIQYVRSIDFWKFDKELKLSELKETLTLFSIETTGIFGPYTNLLKTPYELEQMLCWKMK